MTRFTFHITAFIVLLMLGGCAAQNMRSFPTALSIKSLSGVMLEQQGVLWFRPCNERLWWLLKDYTEQQELAGFYRQFTLDSKEELYIELQGAVDPEHESNLLVKQLDTVGGTASTCDFQLRDIEFRVASSSPYWVADIGSKMTSVKSFKPAGSYHFFTQEESTEDPLIANIYRERTKVAQPLQIKIFSKRCIDPENGTVLPFRAEMTFFGNLYKGCARKGQPSAEFLSGFYWYQPEGKYQVMFKLSLDKRVQLVTRDSRGNAVTERGAWQYLESGKLIFSMLDARENEYLMLFRLGREGQLILQTGSERYASAGASFKLWRPSGLSGGQLLGSRAKPGGVTDATDMKKSELIGSTVLPADIDDELLNEIIVIE
ncbi:hypothetical protein [Amphritea sp.]|uniref:hypothetical protein n=1 Tax=Amphritea sp. TaxID=1872502 RepID=UPI0025C57FA9|nr:hypothetical protein [Amphritea sp.]